MYNSSLMNSSCMNSIRLIGAKSCLLLFEKLSEFLPRSVILHSHVLGTCFAIALTIQ